jgi:hypothetical protein
MNERIERKPGLETSTAQRRLVWPVAIATTALVIAGSAPAVATPSRALSGDGSSLVSGAGYLRTANQAVINAAYEEAADQPCPALGSPRPTVATGVLRSRGWSRDGPASLGAR